jgi:hypothetical protein
MPRFPANEEAEEKKEEATCLGKKKKFATL